MPASRLLLNDRHRIALVRVAARLRERGGEEAGALAVEIMERLAATAAHARAQGAEFGDGHLWDFHGRMMRATPETIAWLAELGGVLELSGTVRERLVADPALCDLTPLLNEAWHAGGVRRD